MSDENNSQKLTSLSEAQIAALDVHKEEWLAKIFDYQNYKNFDDQKCISSVRQLYKFSSLEEPLVMVMDNPFDCQVGANIVHNAICDHIIGLIQLEVFKKVNPEILKASSKVSSKANPKASK